MAITSLFAPAIRLAFCPGRNGKPAIFISKTFDIYIGNLSDDEIVLPPQDLFGSNTGAFEMKLVSGFLSQASIV